MISGKSLATSRSVGEVGLELMILTICGRSLNCDQIKVVDP